MRRSSWGAHLTDVVKSRLNPSGQRGSAPRDFIEMAVSDVSVLDRTCDWCSSVPVGSRVMEDSLRKMWFANCSFWQSSDLEFSPTLRMLHISNVPFVRAAVKSKKIRNRSVEALCHNFQLLERRGVSAAFDQTQEINGQPKHFSELLLGLLKFIPNLPQSPAEVPAKSRQMCLAPLAKSGVISLREPPNGITGAHCGLFTATRSGSLPAGLSRRIGGSRGDLLLGTATQIWS